MKLHPAVRGPYNVITAYGDDYVSVNGARRESSFIVLPDRILEWSVEAFDRLSEESFSSLAGLEVEILLLGTGPRQRFPHPRLTAALAAGHIGVEVLDLKAACRTYNILVAEERKVAAALMFR